MRYYVNKFDWHNVIIEYDMPIPDEQRNRYYNKPLLPRPIPWTSGNAIPSEINVF